MAAVSEMKSHNIDMHPQVFAHQLQNAFKELYLSDLFADVLLKVGDEQLPAHKVVLCSWSETFRAMLETASWKESKQSVLNIEVDEKERVIFKAMLQYMYSGTVKVQGSDAIVSLLSLSNYYGVETLKELCGTILGESLTDDNVFFLLDICEKLECSSLRKMCAEYLAENFEDLLKSAKIMELDAETWAEMLKSDLIQVRSEEDIFNAVLKYCNQFDKEKRDLCLIKIFPSIRFPLMSNEFLIEKVEANSELNYLPIVHQLLHETFRYKVYPTSKPSMSVVSRKGFSSFSSSPNIQLSSDGRTATLITSGTGWVTFNINPPFEEANRYVEVQMTTIGSGGVFLGVGTIIQTGINVGSTTQSWGYMSTGQVYVNGGIAHNFATYTSGDRVGVMLLNTGTSKTLEFYKNGVKVGEVTPFTTSVKLFPQVTFYSLSDSATLQPVTVPTPNQFNYPSVDSKPKRVRGRK